MIFRAQFLAITLTMAGVTAAAAHPHVVVTATSEVLFAPDGSMTGVRHAWTFDSEFSQDALKGVTAASAGTYTRDELTPLARTNVESLRDFAYFTFAKANGRKQTFTAPTDYYLDKIGDALVLHFTLPLKSAVKPQSVALEVYDPDYFVAFTFAKDNPVRLVGAPAGCAVTVERPESEKNGLPVIDREEEKENVDGAIFATKALVTCR